jgi:hypothetical protein
MQFGRESDVQRSADLEFDIGAITEVFGDSSFSKKNGEVGNNRSEANRDESSTAENHGITIVDCPED